MDDLRAAIVAEARSLIGTPWVHQHREPGVGVDCAGVLTVPAKRLLLSDFDLTDYERLPDGMQMIEVCDTQMTRVRIGEMQAGDAIVLRFTGAPQHIAILADYRYGGLSIIHASNLVGKVVEHRLLPELKSKIVAAYRLPGVPA